MLDAISVVMVQVLVAIVLMVACVPAFFYLREYRREVKKAEHRVCNALRGCSFNPDDTLRNQLDSQIKSLEARGKHGGGVAGIGD